MTKMRPSQAALSLHTPWELVHASIAMAVSTEQTPHWVAPHSVDRRYKYMKRSILTALAIVSACTAYSTAFAEEFEGGASLGASYSSIHGQKAKFNEYRSLGDGAQGSLNLNYRGDNGFYLEGKTDFSIVNGKSADSHVTSDMNLNVKAGLADVFKASVFYNEIPHNLTYDARTWLTSGIGTDTMTGPVPAANNINTLFDYGVKRYNYGAEAEISLKSPFFFLTRVERTDMSGLMPITTGYGFETPAPISQTSDSLILQTGYRSNKLIATIDGTVTQFNNDISTFTTQTSDAAYRAYLPPSNNYYKIGGSVMYKIPVMSSTLMARASQSYLDTSFDFRQNIPAGRTTWNGKVSETTASISLTSNPTQNLNTKVYYSYMGRVNGSDQNFNYSPTTGNVKVFNYHKNIAGVDITYKLPAKTKLSTGYEYAIMDRTLTYRTAANTALSDSPETRDHTFYLQAKNDILDWMTAKIRLQRMLRQSNFDYRSTASANYTMEPNRSLYMPAGVADKIQDTVKTGIDFELNDNLGLGVEYVYSQNNYNHTTIGLKYDRRHGFNLDATYAKGIAKLNAYADVEFVRSGALHFHYGTGGATSHYWTSSRKDINYALGTKIDVDVIKDKLTASAGYRYERADGSDAFTISDPTIIPVDMNYADDYIKNSVNAKLSYKFNKNISMDLGYLFEHLVYSDDKSTAYTNYFVSSGNTYRLTGAYANPNYDASVVYTKLNIKF